MIKKLMNSKNVSRINATSGQIETGPPGPFPDPDCMWTRRYGLKVPYYYSKKIIKLTVYVISGNSFDVNL